MLKNEYFRIFLTWFFLTLIIAGFFLGSHWVAIKAERSGFDTAEQLSVERDRLNLTLSLPNKVIEIDLTPLNSAAEKLHQLEGWILPEKLRFLSRFSCFMADKISTGRRQQQEREFYKNAGLV